MDQVKFVEDSLKKFEGMWSHLKLQAFSYIKSLWNGLEIKAVPTWKLKIKQQLSSGYSRSEFLTYCLRKSITHYPQKEIQSLLVISYLLKLNGYFKCFLNYQQSMIHSINSPTSKQCKDWLVLHQKRIQNPVEHLRWSFFCEYS